MAAAIGLNAPEGQDKEWECYLAVEYDRQYRVRCSP